MKSALLASHAAWAFGSHLLPDGRLNLTPVRIFGRPIGSPGSRSFTSALQPDDVAGFFVVSFTL